MGCLTLPRFKSIALVSGLALLGIALSSGAARADDFTFSFTNTFTGGVAGTVTGEILGLTNNTTGPATEVIITSFPSSLISDLGSAPIIATNWTNQYQNSFVESNGVVTAADFEAVNNVPGGAGVLCLNCGGTNALSLDGARTEVYDLGGLAAANITPIAQTPEPSSLVLMATGLLGLGLMARRRILSM